MPSRNGKLRLMREYFAITPDPERGWALAALTGELGFPEAKPSQVRDLAMARVDPELFGWSWDFVGDLAETVALIWPETEKGFDLRFHREPHFDPRLQAGEETARPVEHAAALPQPASGGDGAAGTAGFLPRLQGRVGFGTDASHVPVFSEIVETLR